MELIRGINHIHDNHRGCVLTIGNFDGVHLGHQKVLRSVVEKAHQLGLPSTVMLFEPQPQEYFNLSGIPARLTHLRDKFNQLMALGIERILVINFDDKFAKMTRYDFVHRLLVEQLDVKFLVVGDDFRFGANRSGDFDYLQQEAKKVGFDLVSTQSFTVFEQRVSSTAIRHELAQGHFNCAMRMLGRHYSITGRVSHGKKLGRSIGFPTANIPLKRSVSPIMGVYVVMVSCAKQGQLAKEQKWLGGVANLGVRPTINGEPSPLLEVHIFDLKQEIYGRYICVRFLHKLRDEMKFSSVDELKTQIELDAKAARMWLSDQDNI